MADTWTKAAESQEQLEIQKLVKFSAANFFHGTLFIQNQLKFSE